MNNLISSAAHLTLTGDQISLASFSYSSSWYSIKMLLKPNPSTDKCRWPTFSVVPECILCAETGDCSCCCSVIVLLSPHSLHRCCVTVLRLHYKFSDVTYFLLVWLTFNSRHLILTVECSKKSSGPFLFPFYCLLNAFFVKGSETSEYKLSPVCRWCSIVYFSCCARNNTNLTNPNCICDTISLITTVFHLHFSNSSQIKSSQTNLRRYYGCCTN